jgi:hypothetical protein
MSPRRGTEARSRVHFVHFGYKGDAGSRPGPVEAGAQNSRFKIRCCDSLPERGPLKSNSGIPCLSYRAGRARAAGVRD